MLSKSADRLIDHLRKDLLGIINVKVRSAATRATGAKKPRDVFAPTIGLHAGSVRVADSASGRYEYWDLGSLRTSLEDSGDVLLVSPPQKTVAP